MQVTLKDVLRTQVEASYSLAFLAYMRSDEITAMPEYLSNLSKTLVSLGVDIDRLQLRIVESLNPDLEGV